MHLNNLYSSSVSNHIGSMNHHIEIIRKRCRVCGNLWELQGKGKDHFYQCSEFAAQLFSAFSINDVPGTHPSFILLLVLDRSLQAQDHLLTYKSSIIIFQWMAHAEEDAWYIVEMYMACIPESI